MLRAKVYALLVASHVLVGCAGDDGSGGTETTATTGVETGAGSESESGTGGEDEGANYGGGTRLRPLVWQPEDGPPSRFGWHDSELEHRCEFQLLSDGKLRCVPLTFETPVRFYGDSGCVQPVQTLSALDEAPYPKFAWSSASTADCDGTAATIDIHPLSGALQNGPIYQLDEADGCVQALDEPVEYIPVGPAIDPSTYVAAADALDEGSERILGERRNAEDGSWSYVDAYDQERAVRARVYRTEDGATRWLPQGGVNYNGNTYADSACTEPLGGGPIGRCPDPSEDYVNDRNNNSCREIRVVYGSGAEHLGPVYRTMGNSCEEFVQDDFHFYPVGARIPDADFADATLTSSGAGRILRRYWTALGSPLIESESLIDADHEDVTCRPLADPDGVTRCLPTNLITSSAFVYYLDPECTSAPVGLLPACLGDVPPYGSLHAASCDGECWQPYMFGEEVDLETTPLYRDNGMGCGPDDGLGEDYRYMQLTAIDPVDWATIVEEIQ